MPQIDPQDARQGKSGRPVLMVLIGGLILAVIAFIGMGMFGASQPDENIGTPSDAGISSETSSPAEPAAGGATTVTPAETPPAPASAPAPAN